MKVREEIEEYAAEADKPVLLWLFDRYHWESEWKFVARCTFDMSAKSGFGGNRIWTPTPEGLSLYLSANPLAPVIPIYAWPTNQNCVGCVHSFWRRGENQCQDSMCALGEKDPQHCQLRLDVEKLDEDEEGDLP